MHQPQATPFPTLGSPPAPPLSVDQREGIRNFLSNLIIRSTLDEAAFRKESTFVNKLNLILVQVRDTEGGLMEGNGEVQRVISRGWREHRGINLILVQVRMWGEEREGSGEQRVRGRRQSRRGAVGCCDGGGPEERGQGTSPTSICLPPGFVSRF